MIEMQPNTTSSRTIATAIEAVLGLYSPSFRIA
jgi:hypothetical protein